MSGNSLEALKKVMDELDGELPQGGNSTMGLLQRQLTEKFANVNEEDPTWEQYERLLGIIKKDVEAKEELKTVQTELNNAIAVFKEENDGGFDGNLEDESEILTDGAVRAAAINLFNAYSKLLKKRKEAALGAEPNAARDGSFLQSLSSKLLREDSVRTSEKRIEEIDPPQDKAKKKATLEAFFARRGSQNEISKEASPPAAQGPQEPITSPEVSALLSELPKAFPNVTSEPSDAFRAAAQAYINDIRDSIDHGGLNPDKFTEAVEALIKLRLGREEGTEIRTDYANDSDNFKLVAEALLAGINQGREESKEVTIEAALNLPPAQDEPIFQEVASVASGAVVGETAPVDIAMSLMPGTIQNASDEVKAIVANAIHELSKKDIITLEELYEKVDLILDVALVVPKTDTTASRLEVAQALFDGITYARQTPVQLNSAALTYAKGPEQERGFPGYDIREDSRVAYTGWNCFDYAIGVGTSDRATAVQNRAELVRDAMDLVSGGGDDAKAGRELLAQEIMAACRLLAIARNSPDVFPPDPPENKLLNELLQIQGSRDEKRLLEFCNRKDVCQHYLQNFYGRGQWFTCAANTTGMIDLVAKMYGMQITVRTPQGEVHATEDYRTDPKDPSKQHVVGLVNGNHYVALQTRPAAEESNAASSTAAPSAVGAPKAYDEMTSEELGQELASKEEARRMLILDYGRIVGLNFKVDTTELVDISQQVLLDEIQKIPVIVDLDKEIEAIKVKQASNSAKEGGGELGVPPALPSGKAKAQAKIRASSKTLEGEDIPQPEQLGSTLPPQTARRKPLDVPVQQQSGTDLIGKYIEAYEAKQAQQANGEGIDIEEFITEKKIPEGLKPKFRNYVEDKKSKSAAQEPGLVPENTVDVRLAKFGVLLNKLYDYSDMDDKDPEKITKLPKRLTGWTLKNYREAIVYMDKAIVPGKSLNIMQINQVFSEFLQVVELHEKKGVPSLYNLQDKYNNLSPEEKKYLQDMLIEFAGHDAANLFTNLMALEVKQNVRREDAQRFLQDEGKHSSERKRISEGGYFIFVDGDKKVELRENNTVDGIVRKKFTDDICDVSDVYTQSGLGFTQRPQPDASQLLEAARLGKKSIHMNYVPGATNKWELSDAPPSLASPPKAPTPPSSTNTSVAPPRRLSTRPPSGSRVAAMIAKARQAQSTGRKPADQIFAELQVRIDAKEAADGTPLTQPKMPSSTPPPSSPPAPSPSALPATSTPFTTEQQTVLTAFSAIVSGSGTPASTMISQLPVLPPTTQQAANIVRKGYAGLLEVEMDGNNCVGIVIRGKQFGKQIADMDDIRLELYRLHAEIEMALNKDSQRMTSKIDPKVRQDMAALKSLLSEAHNPRQSLKIYARDQSHPPKRKPEHMRPLVIGFQATNIVALALVHHAEAQGVKLDSNSPGIRVELENNGQTARIFVIDKRGAYVPLDVEPRKAMEQLCIARAWLNEEIFMPDSKSVRADRAEKYDEATRDLVTNLIGATMEQAQRFGACSAKQMQQYEDQLDKGRAKGIVRIPRGVIKTDTSYGGHVNTVMGRAPKGSEVANDMGWYASTRYMPRWDTKLYTAPLILRDKASGDRLVTCKKANGAVCKDVFKGTQKSFEVGLEKANIHMQTTPGGGTYTVQNLKKGNVAAFVNAFNEIFSAPVPNDNKFIRVAFDQSSRALIEGHFANDPAGLKDFMDRCEDFNSGLRARNIQSPVQPGHATFVPNQQAQQAAVAKSTFVPPAQPSTPKPADDSKPSPPTPGTPKLGQH